MYTLKFIHFRSDRDDYEVRVSCPNYHIDPLERGDVDVIAYPTLTDENGVSRRLSKEHPIDEVLSFDVCFIENESGKTIGRINPK